MKRLLPLLLLPVALVGIAATTYTITQLTANNSPSDGTLIEIYDPSASPKSGKYVLTNLVKRAGDNMGPLSVTAFTNSAATASRLAVTGSDKALGSVTSTGLVDGTGATADASDVTGALGYTPVNQAGDTVTGALTVTKAYRSYQGIVTHAGTVTLDFNADTTVNAMALTGDVTFASSNLATNRTYRLRITGTSTNSTPTFPAWHFLGGAPTTLTASKVSMLSLEAWGTSDSSVVASFVEEQ